MPASLPPGGPRGQAGIEAAWKILETNRSPRSLGTRDPHRPTVLAAFAGCGIDNAVVELDATNRPSAMAARLSFAN